MVRYFFEDIDSFRLHRRKLRSALVQLLTDHGHRTGDINIIFCSDTYLLQLNRDFLQHDYFTDIITFGAAENGVVEGELYISVDTVKENATLYGVSFLMEIYRVICHGFLHLVGYDDDSEENMAIIRKKEDYYLNLIQPS